MWENEGFSTMEEPLGTVVSDDVWKKFELDAPVLTDSNHRERLFEDCSAESSDNKNCLDYPEIRHHDCMWAGLCISKEHNKILSTKKDKSFAHKIVTANRSLLISKTSSASTFHQTQEQFPTKNQHPQRIDNLESDGDSTRPETSQSSSESDTDSEHDVPIFKHDQFSINDKLIECMSAPVSEVTGQCVRSSSNIKVEVNETDDNETDDNDNSIDIRTNVNTSKQTEISNTLNDHCYYINHQNSKKVDYLGVQTPSDSDEEIDVVTFEKPAALPTLPSTVDHKVFQSTVNTVLNDKPVPRPRGRPPNVNRKRPAQSQAQEQRPAKRIAVQRSCQKKPLKVSKNSPLPSTSTDIVKYTPPSIGTSDDDEPDTDKRNLHNNMERQRRIELRNAFDDLRCLVPELKIKEKAPKVAILRQGGKFCIKIRELEEELIAEKIELKKRQDKLRTKLSYLRRCLAKKR
ncbi:transcriptional regulator Myc-B [Microplitis mediator]|uniref:transcriptional regulator Myc-B n=1 Tax=Microplitis mediator TaxID=375433 RepID=UPI00255576ED|nr:transcriptional regulator Myc-B [Microplitis mediator]XP_057318688.1 transcriptional regulator Myc-B [Microplitis mediator]XP_057318689.1 transcriptional regulator Myc-B [Microplitis mediator]